jgi:hypothetical protein
MRYLPLSKAAEYLGSLSHCLEKRDTKNNPRRQGAGMTLSLPDPAHGDWAQYDEWGLSARILKALAQITAETGLAGWGGRIRTPEYRRKISL